MEYKQKILDDFHADLFSTVYKDCPSVVQNAKTDILCDEFSISFDDWFNELIDVHCVYGCNNSIDAETLKKAIEAEPKFKEDMKSEFDKLKEAVAETLAEEAEDAEDED